MHDLFKVYLTLPKEPVPYGYNQQYGGGASGGSSLGGSSNFGTQDLGVIYGRIIFLQNIIVEALKTNDTLIQEKVAEIALTGVKDENP